MKAYKGSRSLAPHILNLDSRQRWVVNFMPQLLYPYKEHGYLLISSLSEPQVSSRHFDEKKNLSSLTVVEPYIIQPVAWSLSELHCVRIQNILSQRTWDLVSSFVSGIFCLKFYGLLIVFRVHWMEVCFIILLLPSKGKAVPLQAWSGPEGSRKLRFPDFMTTAQDGGKVVSLTYRPPLPPGNTPGAHFC
jgi:hypothetical protein